MLRKRYPSRHTTSFQRLYDVYTMSLTSYRRRIDVETTSCVYWDYNIYNTSILCKLNFAFFLEEKLKKKKEKKAGTYFKLNFVFFFQKNSLKQYKETGTNFALLLLSRNTIR